MVNWECYKGGQVQLTRARSKMRRIGVGQCVTTITGSPAGQDHDSATHGVYVHVTPESPAGGTKVASRWIERECDQSIEGVCDWEGVLRGVWPPVSNESFPHDRPTEHVACVVCRHVAGKHIRSLGEQIVDNVRHSLGAHHQRGDLRLDRSGPRDVEKDRARARLLGRHVVGVHAVAPVVLEGAAEAEGGRCDRDTTSGTT